MPRQVAIATAGLALSLACVELLGMVVRSSWPSAAPWFRSGITAAVLLISPLIILFYASPILLWLERRSGSNPLLSGVAGFLPGLGLGALAGSTAYGVLVGVLAGVFSGAIQHRLALRSREEFDAA